MDKSVVLLDSITEGVVLLDEQLNILHWNREMQELTSVAQGIVNGSSIFEVLPALDQEHYRFIFDQALHYAKPYFFSAKIHHNIVVSNRFVNFSVNRIQLKGKKVLIMEFDDATQEFERVKQLKANVEELSRLNEDLRQKEEEIAKLAYKDSLTGLSNRVLFYSFAENMIARSKRNGTPLGILFIDVDNFKTINDTYGHQVGDETLKTVAQLLLYSTRESDMVFRFGGDEFVVLLQDLVNTDCIQKIIRRIHTAASETVLLDGEFPLVLSIGCSMYPKDAEDIDELVRRADDAMYVQKRANKVNAAE